MEHGDFTSLAKEYINRPAYSLQILKILSNYIGAGKKDFCVADVGAGTGKLTENLTGLGLRGFAVEPNKAMRSEALKLGGTINNFIWLEGSAEKTGLETASCDWVVMASSFHWADKKAALSEFFRILKPNGFFTAMWNPRDIEKSQLHIDIEKMVKSHLPNFTRVSSGAKKYISNIEEELLSTGQFKDLVFMEASHEVVMSKERYIGAWRSVNDIQVQAGSERFERIISDIQEFIKNEETIRVPYKTRAWTVQVNKKNDS